MVFTKTIIHIYKDSRGIGFNDFITGTLSLMQYGFDTNIKIKVNIENTYLSEYLRVVNANTQGYLGKVYVTEEDMGNLFRDLEEFKVNTTPILIVTTNWAMHPRRISRFAIIEFKNTIHYKPSIYNEATTRARSELLNINLPHTDPVITPVILETYVPECNSPVWSPSDYCIIYVDINPDICLRYLDTLKLANTIRSSLLFDKNSIVISSNKELGDYLTELLEVNYIPNQLTDYDTNSGSLLTISWSPLDEIVNYVLIANAKKLYVFSEQSKSVSKEYSLASQIGKVSIQHFAFFYSRVEISPMPL
jgi:hypothetical protein